MLSQTSIDKHVVSSQHHVPHHPHLFHHFPQNGVVATHAEAKTPWMIRTLLGIEVNRIGGNVIGERLNFELCLTRLSFIKVTTSVTLVSIYRLGSFLEKLS